MFRAEIASLQVDDLDGTQKSAILCMALGTEVAAEVMKSLQHEDVERVSREIAAIPVVKQEMTEAILTEFTEVAKAVGHISSGGTETAREILERALGPQRAEHILKRIQEQVIGSSLKHLKKAAPDILMSVLGGEHPQTIALILAHLDAKQAAGVIEEMSPELASDVLYRVAKMEKVAPDMLELIDQGLASKADLSLSTEMKLSGGPAAVADVLNITSASMEKALLENLAERSEELVEEIKNLMFVFEDLTAIDARSMQRLLREVDGRDLALALKAASDGLKQHITGNMSERAAQALLEEMEYMGPVRVKDVEAAQIKIIGVVRSLEEAGEIVLGSHSGEDDIIV